MHHILSPSKKFSIRSGETTYMHSHSAWNARAAARNKGFVKLRESVRLLLFSLQSFCWLDLSQDDTFTSCSQYLFLDDSNLL